MHARSSIVALTSALAFASCATTGEASPLIAGEYQEARLALRTGNTDLTPPPWKSEEREDERLPTVTVQTRFLTVEPKLAERILGERAVGLVSLLSTRAQTDAALGELFADEEIPDEAEIQVTMLTLRDGQTGSVLVVQQEAYIESYELVVTPHAALADPSVGVVHDGVMLLVNTHSDPETGEVALDLELTMTEYERPFKERQVELTGSAAPVKIQVPEGLIRRLTTSASLGTEDVLVIGGSALPMDDGKVLVAFVAVQPVEN